MPPYGSTTKKTTAKKVDEPKKKRSRAMRFDETDISTAQTPRQMAEAQARSRRARKATKAAQPTRRQRAQASAIATRRTARGGY